MKTDKLKLMIQSAAMWFGSCLSAASLPEVKLAKNTD
jgi:hypothetical protein